MPVIPYRQTQTHSCLAACFLMLLQDRTRRPIDEGAEQELTLKGSLRSYPFYVVGIPTEFANAFQARIRIFAHNKYFTGFLEKAFRRQKRISVQHHKITHEFLRALLRQHPIVFHIDDHYLGRFSGSHFVILEKELPNDRVLLIDPWTGKRKRLSFAKLEESMESLKTHMKMCPLVFILE